MPSYLEIVEDCPTIKIVGPFLDSLENCDTMMANAGKSRTTKPKNTTRKER